MIFRLRSYLKFLWESQNEHGLHSPFVFKLVTECFYDKTDYAEYKLLQSYKENLLKCTEQISVTDFGAGSKVFRSNVRKVSEIAKVAGTSPSRRKLLFRLARYFKPESILEIGTSVGLGTSALALGNPDANVTSIEGCGETARMAQNFLNRSNIENVDVHVCEFTSFIKSMDRKFDLVFFDGNHQREATLQYFESLLPTATNASVWIFDDIHWSRDMELAWETVKLHPRVTVTVDTYQFGFVFFRKEQAKENFVIRA